MTPSPTDPPGHEAQPGPDGRAGIDTALVRRLVADEFPQWAGLPVRPVAVDGWDNRTYRLGDDLSVRLPTHDRYVAAVEKEARWLPVLAPYLPVPVPEVVASGKPGEGYPHPWSVRRWVGGATVSAATVGDDEAQQLALDLADFLGALRAAPANGGPVAGEHCFHRGGDLGVYGEEAREAFGSLEPDLGAGALDVFETALTSQWGGEPVWFHGDVATGNLLVRDGRLAAVIDFGTCGIGDPACDLVFAWTFLEGAAREVFRSAVGLDVDTWARARGWAVWKSAVDLEGREVTNLRILRDVVAEHRVLTRTGR
ncbi:aminoglycoside phosphotransferase family protein [Pedococcus aerophilus]|uniref:aminoglycoside phosphotransferase family protein n=1 Tax=Pedococcus aerophilus TaxID=436356 RepID=UPI0031E1CE79